MHTSNPSNSELQHTNDCNLILRSKCQDSTRETQHLSNIFVVYFDWLFFLGISPFRLVRENKNLFKTQKNYIQMIVSFALSILAVLFNLSAVRIGFGSDQFKDFTNPRNYFYFATFFLAYLFHTWFLLQLWFHPRKILSIVNVIQSTHYLSQAQMVYLKNKYALHFLNLLLYGFVLSEAILKSLPPSILLLQGNMWNTQTILNGRFTFFVSNLTSFQEIIDLDQVSNFDYVLAGLYVLGFFQW